MDSTIHHPSPPHLLELQSPHQGRCSSPLVTRRQCKQSNTITEPTVNPGLSSDPSIPAPRRRVLSDPWTTCELKRYASLTNTLLFGCPLKQSTSIISDKQFNLFGPSRSPLSRIDSNARHAPRPPSSSSSMVSASVCKALIY
ncbi:hypothetical protein J6590_040179 [Homalodisca vitripennis]|nr:hypothetical protein J6590_040179 [Homalodisca vitripennis]